MATVVDVVFVEKRLDESLKIAYFLLVFRIGDTEPRHVGRYDVEIHRVSGQYDETGFVLIEVDAGDGRHYLSVWHCFISPDVKPVVKYCIRCLAEPWVKVSGWT